MEVTIPIMELGVCLAVLGLGLAVAGADARTLSISWIFRIISLVLVLGADVIFFVSSEMKVTAVIIGIIILIARAFAEAYVILDGGTMSSALPKWFDLAMYQIFGLGVICSILILIGAIILAIHAVT